MGLQYTMRNGHRLMDHLTAAGSLYLTIGLCTAAESPLRLWYDKPAAKWEEALPLGNGRLGAMVFGGTTGQPVVYLLPALPREWPAGSARGLRARGGFEVDCAWRDGRLTEATIHSKRGGACRVVCPAKIIALETKAGRNYRLNGELGERSKHETDQER
jgi:hypothetical protein